jgi:hypothetical protein
VRADGDDTQTLREAVASYVASAKMLRLPPQEMLVELKVQLHEAAQHLPAHEYNALRSRVVSWAIDDYYNDHGGGRDGDGGQ